MRQTLIMIGIIIVAVAIGVTVFSYDYGTPPAATVEPGTQGTAKVPFQELARGDHSTVLTRKNYIIRSASELSEAWGMIEAPGQPPEVDFETNDVIAVFAGKRPTAGYEISVDQVEDGISRKVVIILTSPGGSCLLAQELTQPYQLIELPKTNLALTHEDTTTTTSCLR